ncbi:EscU/YscU/HrcU family type III secretion system export apparatus switch protein [Tepidibacter formicigenes]|nr:EscU/YscU/HrcU family type III secretion system export apparatus switch protein [Tepidibacter formicigenes]
MKKAVALSYNEEINYAPRVTASGKGYVAEKIIKKAKENNVPLYKDDNLTNNLINLDLGSEIPRELFEIVAKVLVFVENIDQKKGEKE